MRWTRTHAAAERCAQEIMEAVPPVMRFIGSEMRRRGAPSLSVPQLRTLLFLSRRPGTDLSTVADHLGVTDPTACAIVSRLVRRGLVGRAEDPRERRCVVLTLTRAGSQRLQHARDAACSDVADVLAHLSEGDLQRVSEGVALLGKAFGEVGDRNGR